MSRKDKMNDEADCIEAIFLSYTQTKSSQKMLKEQMILNIIVQEYLFYVMKKNIKSMIVMENKMYLEYMI